MRSSSTEDGAGLRVLLVNFEMNPHSPVLGWQYRVAAELTARCEKVVVLTERASGLPPGFGAPVWAIPRILQSPLRALGSKWLVNVLAAYLVVRYRVNVVFVHMSMEWAYRLAPTFGTRRVPVLLWYAHGAVSNALVRAERSASMVVTSSPEGFRLRSSKVRVIGQGVDADAFTTVVRRTREPRVMYVGRISRRKRVHVLIEAMALLRRSTPDLPVVLRIVGPALSADDRRYLRELDERAARLGVRDRIEIRDAVPPGEVPRLYEDVTLHVSASDTGSMDKTVLESLAAGCPVLTTNEAFSGLLADAGRFLPEATPEAFAAAIPPLLAHPPAPHTCRARIVGHHDLPSYAGRVTGCLRELVTAAPALPARSPIEQA